MYLLRSRYIMLLLLSLSHIWVLILGLSLVHILSKHYLKDCSHHCDLSKPLNYMHQNLAATRESGQRPASVCRATIHGAARLTRQLPWHGKSNTPAAMAWQGWHAPSHVVAVKAAANGTRYFCYVLTWAKLFRHVGLTNRSVGRLSAWDNQYTSSAILTYTRPKFIASSIIPLFSINSASHNYDTSSSIHKFDITRHTTCSISIWVSEYKCIMSS